MPIVWHKICEKELKQRMMKKKRFQWLTLLFLMFGALTACAVTDLETQTVVEGEWYSTKEEVAEYLYLYEELPPNYLTKSEANDLGWDSQAGNLWEVADGMSIGGDYFGNWEGLLPEDQDYYEADINYQGGYRNAERIIFSEEGLIFYTDDHYASFEQLYGEEE